MTKEEKLQDFINEQFRLNIIEHNKGAEEPLPMPIFEGTEKKPPLAIVNRHRQIELVNESYLNEYSEEGAWQRNNSQVQQEEQ